MSAPTILQKIADERRGDVARLQQEVSLKELQKIAEATPAPRGRFKQALQQDGLSLIAEVKRASPSKGRIADIPAPVDLAKAYADGGASAISVLTEPRHFLGSEEDLRAVAKASGLPVLRKDFIIDPYMIWEARAWGASACLLIVALLPTVEELAPLLQEAKRAGLDVLVETHDAEEVNVAVKAGADIIGVNHRNLHTFEVDITLFERLRPLMGDGIVTVAESGILDPQTARQMQNAGADAILVGEYLARASDPAQTARALIGGIP